jgi:hypothetical protein
MKTLAICTLISVFVIFCTNAEEPPKDKREVNTIWTSMERIDGTVLMRSDVSTGPEGSKNLTRSCTVGYKTAPTGNKEGEFVPVLALPPLKNDAYIMKVADGELRVTTKNAGSMVVTLNLRNLVPSLLAE